MRLGIYFGVFSEPLVKQLSGLRIPREDVLRFQEDADAISRLNVRGILADGASDAARKRLMKKIIEAIPKKRASQDGKATGET